jgi:hypothetical protein
VAGQIAEHLFVLDFFVSFCIKAKRKERTPSREKEKENLHQGKRTEEQNLCRVKKDSKIPFSIYHH